MLHVHGGAIVLERLRAAGLPGGFLEWAEVLCQGPLPAGLNGDAWREVRAAFLEDPSARARLAEQDAALERALATEDEIVLWFSADWFCQAILVGLLARCGAPVPASSSPPVPVPVPSSPPVPLPSSPPVPLPLTGEGGRRTARLSVVSLGNWPGVEDHQSCVLAHMSAAQLRDAFARRVPVTAALVAQARLAWDALRSPDPRALLAVTDGALPDLPFVREGLRRHLEEFPAPHTGVNTTEHHLLEALAAGPATALALFPVVANRERRRWITDTIFVAALRRLAAAPAPLVRLAHADRLRGPLSADVLEVVTAELTPTGQRVLAGEADWIALAGIERWVGGVHLTAGRVWRWDSAGGLRGPA